MNTGNLNGWDVTTNEPEQVRHRVLLTPGLFCSKAFFQDMLEEGSLDRAGIKAIGTSPPGFGGNPAPPDFDYSIESYAALYEQFAAEQSIDLIVGHSFGANVGIEIAARGNFTGPQILLAPSLQAEDEVEELRQLYYAGKKPVIGTLLWLWLPTSFKKSFKDEFPGPRHDELIAEMRSNPRKASRRQVDAFFEHVERYGSLAERLAASNARVWLVRGDRDDVQDTEEEIAIIDAAANVERRTLPGLGHFSVVDDPGAVNALIVEMLTAAGPPLSRSGRPAGS